MSFGETTKSPLLPGTIGRNPVVSQKRSVTLSLRRLSCTHGSRPRRKNQNFSNLILSLVSDREDRKETNLPEDFQPCYSPCTSSLPTSLSPASSSHPPTSHPTTPASPETPSCPSQLRHRSRPERKMMPASSPQQRHPSTAMLPASAPTFASEVHETPWRRSLEEIEPCLSLPCGR